MENSTPQPQKTKSRTAALAVFASGILILILACLSLGGSVMLDTVGAKAIGKLSNVSKGCPPGKSCWTSKVEFTTTDGEPVAFYPLTFPILFDFDPVLSGRPYAEYGQYQVRYLASFPKLAKVKLAFFLEYINLLCGVGLGGFLALFGFLSARGLNPNKPYKPIVLDLSRFRQK